jgi:hypothetical protein
MIPTSKPKSNNQPWCVVRLLPNSDEKVIARFYRYSDADGYLRTMRRRSPNITYKLVVHSSISEEPDNSEAVCL